MVVFAPPRRVFNTTFMKISKVKKKIKFCKYFEQLFFPAPSNHVFRMFFGNISKNKKKKIWLFLLPLEEFLTQLL